MCAELVASSEDSSGNKLSSNSAKRHPIGAVSERKKHPSVHPGVRPDDRQTVFGFAERARPPNRDLHFDMRKKLARS